MVFILLFQGSYAQQASLKGKVTDDNGESLIGAVVFLKDNPAVGAITDLDGQFILEIPSGQKILIPRSI